MTAVPASPGAEIGGYVDGPCPQHNRLLAWWPVPQLGARVYELVAAARDGATTQELALLFGISDFEALLLCLHHDVVPRRRRASKQSPQHRSFVEHSLPPGDR